MRDLDHAQYRAQHKVWHIISIQYNYTSSSLVTKDSKIIIILFNIEGKDTAINIKLYSIVRCILISEELNVGEKTCAA